MNKLLILSIVLVFVGSSFTISGHNIEQKTLLQGNILYVGGSGSNNFTKIQDAIDNCSDGDVVFVFDNLSPYYESIVINKSIDLIGQDQNTTTIIGMDENYGSTITILKNGTTIQGFTIQVPVHGDGIYILSCSENTVQYNHITNCAKGILVNAYPTGSDYHTIQYNKFNNDEIAISLWYSDCSTIFNNSISNCSTGIYMSGYGHHKISENIMLDLGYGIYNDQWSNGNNMSKNVFCNNNYGIYTIVSDYSLISLNRFEENKLGLFIEGCHYTLVEHNLFKNNELGVKLYHPRVCNISYNNFIENSLDGDFHYWGNIGTRSDGNTWSHNYWDSHKIINIIQGKKLFGLGTYSQFNVRWLAIDWHPASQPYDIP